MLFDLENTGYFLDTGYCILSSIIDIKMNRQTESLLDLPLDEQNKKSQGKRPCLLLKSL